MKRFLINIGKVFLLFLSGYRKPDIKNKLLEYYTKCIEEIKEIEDWQQYLDDKDIHLGLCFCARHTFDEEIYGAYWIRRNSIHGKWNDYPSHAETKEEAIHLLQFRLNKLKELTK